MAFTPSSLLPFLLLPFLLFLLPSSHAQSSSPSPSAFVFPVTKHSPTNQYYTSITVGSNPPTTFNAVVDLGGRMLFFYFIPYFNAASTYRPIRCASPQCRIADGIGCIFCFLSPPVPGCTNNTCSIDALNPFTGTVVYSGLGHDTLRVYSARGAVPYPVNNFPFQYSLPAILEGLAPPAAGVVGLGRTRIALPAQLASAFKIREKFALCLPTSSTGSVGNLIVGQVAYSGPFKKIASSLYTTPLVRNPVGNADPNDVIGNLTAEYFIDVRSIKVGTTALSLNKTLLSINRRTGDGGTAIRTVRAYTNLHPSIYNALIAEFVKAAAARNIRRVASVAPFGACFDSKTIGTSATGPDVPTIDLVLQSKNVYWRFYGWNSMVRVSNSVMCLAFVEGPPNISGPTTSIAVGGYQMENYLLEFDLASSRLGFSSSLVMQGTSCSQFRAA